MAASVIPLKNHIVWLNLSNIKVSPAHLKIITQLHNLRYVYLSNSGVTDLTTPELAKLSNLHFLNLVRTEVGEAGLKSLLPTESLQELFVIPNSIIC